MWWIKYKNTRGEARSPFWGLRGEWLRRKFSGMFGTKVRQVLSGTESPANTLFRPV